MWHYPAPREYSSTLKIPRSVADAASLSLQRYFALSVVKLHCCRYRRNALAPGRWPADPPSENLHICRWSASMPDRPVLSIIGAADDSSTIRSKQAIALSSDSIVTASAYSRVWGRTVFCCSQKKKRRNLLINGANWSVMYCGTSKPSLRSRKGCLSVPTILLGIIANMTRCRKIAGMAIILRRCGIPRKSTA